jgi:hypothetical protein
VIAALRVPLLATLMCCGTDVAGVDAPAVDGPPGPFDLPPRCTSNGHWKFGDQGSPLMHPGVACSACHVTILDAPQFGAAGTVYATGHEPDNCNGATQATVVIVDATGAMFSTQTNTAGNFYLFDQLVFPIRAQIVVGGAMRAMTGAVPTGDCNGCHTQDGMQGAPGRIALP